MKIRLLFLVIFHTYFSVSSQTIFNFDTSAIENPPDYTLVTETINGISLDVTGTATSFTGLTPYTYAGSSGNVVANSDSSNPLEMTFTFSEAVDISSVIALEGFAMTLDFTFTPTGGTNSVVVASIINGGILVDLNWTDVTSFTVTATGSTAISLDNLIVNPNDTYIPDDNFEQALIDLGYDSGVLDDYVPTANINALLSLNVSNKSIVDLTGIEDFVSLTNLNCSNNQLTGLDVTQNTMLTHLFCDTNQLTNLDITQNLNLTHLISVNNQLSNLNVSQNLALTYLATGINQITSLDVSQNTSLAQLYCLDNQLTSLNVKNGNNTNFTVFSSGNNPNLTCIEVDDAAWSNANWTNIDPASTFVNNQSECDLLSNEDLTQLDFNIYPNPVNDVVILQIGDIAKYQIISVRGKILQSGELSVGENRIELTDMSDGLYFVKLSSENGNSTKKLIKQ